MGSLYGLLENLVVVYEPCDKGEYKLISGERRWRALKLLSEQGNKEFEVEARREGMAFALKIAKEKGIEALENECKFRNATRIPMAVSRKASDELEVEE